MPGARKGSTRTSGNVVFAARKDRRSAVSNAAPTYKNMMSPFPPAASSARSHLREVLPQLCWDGGGR
jgi:hypothetical protein